MHRTHISFTPEELDVLRHLAASHATTPGLVARALVRAGLDRIDEPDTVAHVREVVDADKARRRETALRVNAQRSARRGGQGGAP